MKNLLNLLERFNRSLNKDLVTKELISKVIQEKIGLTLPTEDISLKEGVLELQAGSSLKMAIKLKEEAVLSDLKGAGIPVVRILYK